MQPTCRFILTNKPGWPLCGKPATGVYIHRFGGPKAATRPAVEIPACDQHKDK